MTAIRFKDLEIGETSTQPQECPLGICDGSGTAYDLVPYGNVNVRMPVACECTDDGEDDERREVAPLWMRLQAVALGWTG